VAAVVGVDDGSVYLGTSDDKLVRRDLRTGESRLVGPMTSTVRDVADGRFAVNLQADGSVVVSTDLTATQPSFPGRRADLSPGARYLATEDSDVSRFYDLRSGAAKTVRHPGHPVLLVTQWLDDGEFVALGAGSSGKSFDLLTCSVVSGDCETTVPEVAAIGEDDTKMTFRAPTGRTFSES